MVIFPRAHPPDAIAEANVLHLFLRDAHSHALRHLHTRSHRPNRYAQPAHQPLFAGLGANCHKQRYAYHGPKTDKQHHGSCAWRLRALDGHVRGHTSFGEPLALPIVIGFVLIIASVFILVLSKRKTG